MNLVKNGSLFLFIILVSGLILSSVLGGSWNKEGYTDMVTLVSGVTKSSTDASSNITQNTSSLGYDNYDHYSQTSAPTTYYGPNGSTANVANNNGDFSIIVKGTNGETTTYSTSAPVSKTVSSNTDSISSLMKQFGNTTFYGPNGGSARFFTGNDGQYAIEVTKSTGDTIIYTATNTYTYNYNNNDASKKTSSYNAFPFATTPPASEAQNNKSQSPYNSSLPSGIPKSMIPPGQENLYILKSEVVPPVCPACPSSSACPSNKKEKCPPCPACARCPEPSFECKKVPNYKNTNSSSYGSYDATGNYNSHGGNSNGGNSNGASSLGFTGTGSPGYLPVPVLSDFSTFGM